MQPLASPFRRIWLGPTILLALIVTGLTRAADSGIQRFDYSVCLLGQVSTLQVRVARLESSTRTVEFNGMDTARPGQPFTWDWGDGQQSRGFFPQVHVYGGTNLSYRASVTAHYADGRGDTAEVLVRFGRPRSPSAHAQLPTDVSVRIPRQMPTLRPTRAPYQVKPTLTVFDDSFFPGYSRETVEYVLTVAAIIQLDLANNDVCRNDGRFEQVLLRDSEFPGMYSLWYTDPVGFGVGDHGFDSSIGWSSLFHEMGHNVTLNSPAKFHWGLKQDGPANTFYSEVLAQIFQHATAYELLNHRAGYGLGEDIAWDIAESACATMTGVRRAFERYMAGGCRFSSWQDGASGEDSTFDTFMTIAFKFCERAERNRAGFREPVKRLMAFLQRFNPEWEKAFSARKNSPEAEQFRATLWAGALSHAFRADLRAELRQLKFPVQDEVFQRLKPLGD